MKGDVNGAAGPLLASGYDYVCRTSRDPSGDPEVWDNEPSAGSHEHLCIAWKTSKASQVGQPTDINSFNSRPESMDPSDVADNCYGDYGTFSVDLAIDGLTIRFSTFHSSISNTDCRDAQILDLVGHVREAEYSVWAGDFEGLTDLSDVLPEGHFTVYSNGRHWGSDKHPGEVTSTRGAFTHAMMNFGEACTDCGDKVYGTNNLEFGSAVGPYHGHRRWDGYNEDETDWAWRTAGGDHYQILTDVTFPAPSDSDGLGAFLDTPLGVLAIVGIATAGAAVVGALGLFVLRKMTADPYGEGFAKANPAPFGKEEEAGWRKEYTVAEPTGAAGMQKAELAPYTAMGGAAAAAPAPRRASGGSKRRQGGGSSRGGSSRGSSGSRRRQGGGGGSKGSKGSRRGQGGSGRVAGNVGGGVRRNVPSALDPTSFNYTGGM